MPVEVETVRSVEVPTRLVHGVGAISRLGETLRELGVTRPLLVTRPGCRRGRPLRASARAPRRRGRLRRGSTESGHRAGGRGCEGVRRDGARRARRARRRVVARHREVDRRGSAPRRLDRRLRVGPRSARAADPAAGRDPDDSGHGERGDALGGDHRSRTEDQVQRRRYTAHRGARGAHRPGAHARASRRRSPRRPGWTRSHTQSSATRAITTSRSTTPSRCRRSSSSSRWLRRAVETGSDVEARTHMAHAATLGGMAYGTESAGAAHAMSQSAGGVHDCPHGALTARVLGPVMEYNAPADPLAACADRPGARGRHERPLGPRGAHSPASRSCTGSRTTSASRRWRSSASRRTRSRCSRGSRSTTRRRSGNAREVDVEAYEDIYRNAFARGKR